MRNLSKTIVSEKVTLIDKDLIMDIQMQSICWFVLGVILFIVALFLDKELRAEMKDIRTASVCIFTVIALYGAIMWICDEWLTWCM